MNDLLLRNFSQLAQRIQQNFVPQPDAPVEFPEETGVLLNQRDGDPRGFVIQPLCSVMEKAELQDRNLYRRLTNLEGLLELHATLLSDFPDLEYWALHQYVHTTRLLVEEGYAVHMYDGDEDDYTYVPPMIFTKPSAPVPVVCIQEVDAEQFLKLLNGVQTMMDLPDDSVKH